jgi:exonuclease SbcD
VVIIAGNHDSPTRLEVPTPFLSAFDMVVVGQVTRVDGQIDLERLLVPLRNQSGVTEAWCLAVPFLRPADVPRLEEAEDAYLDGIAALYSQLTDLAQAKRTDGQALLALGHLHMVGAQISEESERKLVMGSVEALSASIFAPDIAYVALGHLHLAQKVGHNHIRYCGTPLPMSFSEIHYPHQVLVLELAQSQLVSVQPLLIPRFVELQRLPAKPAPLEEVLAGLQQQQWPELPDDQQAYLQVRVLLDQPEPSLRSKIEQALDGKAVRLVKIESTYQRQADDQATPDLALADVNKLQPEDVFLRLYQQKYGNAPSTALLSAFRDLLSQAAAQGDEA